jgi:hypothetical protein
LIQERTKLPRCLGHHDPNDVICEGDPSGEMPEDKQHCVYVDRCVAFQKHLSVSGQVPGDHIVAEKVLDFDGKLRLYAFSRGDDSAFKRLLSEAEYRWKVKDGRVTATKPRDPASRPRGIDNLLPGDGGEKLVGWFVKCLSDGIEGGIDVKVKRTYARPGDIFVVDNMKKSKYLALYGELARARRVGIVLLYPQSRTESMRVHFAASVSSFSKKDVEALGLRKDGGRFNSKTGNLDKEGVAIAAEALAGLINRGIIVLPRAK